MMSSFIKHYMQLMFALVFFFLYSCNNLKRNDLITNKSDRTDILGANDTISCSNSIFYKTISTYIDNIWKSTDVQWYTSIYFSKNDTIDYFTIWTFTSYPDYIKTDIPLSMLDYNSIEINDTDVILIANKSATHDVFSKLLQPCIDKIKVIEQNGSNSMLIYDGRWFIESYKYFSFEGKLIIDKLEEPIVDFLGNPPNEFW